VARAERLSSIWDLTCATSRRSSELLICRQNKLCWITRRWGGSRLITGYCAAEPQWASPVILQSLRFGCRTRLVHVGPGLLLRHGTAPGSGQLAFLLPARLTARLDGVMNVMILSMWTESEEISRLLGKTGECFWGWEFHAAMLDEQTGHCAARTTSSPPPRIMLAPFLFSWRARWLASGTGSRQGAALASCKTAGSDAATGVRSSGWRIRERSRF